MMPGELNVHDSVIAKNQCTVADEFGDQRAVVSSRLRCQSGRDRVSIRSFTGIIACDGGAALDPGAPSACGCQESSMPVDQIVVGVAEDLGDRG
jgi:hypothetical protein